MGHNVGFTAQAASITLERADKGLSRIQCLQPLVLGPRDSGVALPRMQRGNRCARDTPRTDTLCRSTGTGSSAGSVGSAHNDP